jgi:hypothetical protein
MPSPDEKTQRPATGITLPINLVHQTIAYLECHSDPMAAMLKENYKYFLQMSIPLS